MRQRPLLQLGPDSRLWSYRLALGRRYSPSPLGLTGMLRFDVGQPLPEGRQLDPLGLLLA